ncbi:hypothetical protein Hanom_Chr17g01581771 [Helianthus anomalus]
MFQRMERPPTAERMARMADRSAARSEVVVEMRVERRRSERKRGDLSIVERECVWGGSKIAGRLEEEFIWVWFFYFLSLECRERKRVNNVDNWLWVCIHQRKYEIPDFEKDGLMDREKKLGF